MNTRSPVPRAEVADIGPQRRNEGVVGLAGKHGAWVFMWWVAMGVTPNQG